MLFEQLGEHSVNGRPCHSQSQELIERGNGTGEEKLAKMKEDLNNTKSAEDIFPWSSWLPLVMYPLNTKRSETTKQLPYKIMFGQKPRGNLFPDAKTGLIDKENVLQNVPACVDESANPSNSDLTTTLARLHNC